MAKKLISYDEGAPADPLPAVVRDWLDGRFLQSTAYPYDLPFMHTSGQRAVGYGDMPDGFLFDRNVTVTKITYLGGTADSSGASQVELRNKAGNTIAGTAANVTLDRSTNDTSITGEWSFAPGDVVRPHINSVGGTAGDRLTVFMVGTAS